MINIEQKKWTNDAGWTTLPRAPLSGVPQIVLVFGASALVSKENVFADVKGLYPSSHVVMMSTAGEILDTSVSDGSLSLLALFFEKTALIVRGLKNKVSGQGSRGDIPFVADIRFRPYLFFFLSYGVQQIISH